MQKVLPVFLVLLVVFSFSGSGVLYPDPCCDYFQESDAQAFRYLDENLPDNSLILISSFKNSTINSGTDAGLWITPLLKLPTNNFYYDANWAVPDRLEEICEFGAEHVFVYVGGREYSFNNTVLAQTTWYEEVFHSGQTVIYRVKSCLE